MILSTPTLSLAENIERTLPQFVEKIFHWTEQNSHEISRVGMLTNLLILFVDVSKMNEFIAKFATFVSFSFADEIQNEVAEKIFQFADQYVPSGRQAKFCRFDITRNGIEWPDGDDIISDGGDRLVRTVKMNVYFDLVRSYFEKDVSFLLIGPSGCGKRFAETCDLLTSTDNNLMVFLLLQPSDRNSRWPIARLRTDQNQLQLSTELDVREKCSRRGLFHCFSSAIRLFI